MEPSQNNTIKPASQAESKPKPDKLAIYYKFADSKLITAAILAFFPVTGVIGIHDFILKQNKRGILHVLIFATAHLPIVITGLICKFFYSDGCYVATIATRCLAFLSIGSYIWAVVEGVCIIKAKYSKYIPFQDLPPSPPSDEQPYNPYNSQ